MAVENLESVSVTFEIFEDYVLCERHFHSSFEPEWRVCCVRPQSLTTSEFPPKIPKSLFASLRFGVSK